MASVRNWPAFIDTLFAELVGKTLKLISTIFRLFGNLGPVRLSEAGASRRALAFLEEAF